MDFRDLGGGMVALRTTDEAVADERSGLLVEPADAIGLAAALGRLLDDSTVRREFGVVGRKIVEREFALDRNVDAFIDRLGDR